MENKIESPKTQNASEDMVPKTDGKKTKIRIYRILCILLFASGIVFFTIFLIKYQYIITLHYPMLIYMDYISLFVIAAMVTALICFLITFKKTPVIKIVALILAGAVLAAGWYVYFRYFPKYGPLEACAAVQADPNYAFKSVEPDYYHYSIVKDNPFCNTGYCLNVISNGEVTEWIMFDSTTGRYESHEPID